MCGGEIRGRLRPFLLVLIHERPGHGYDLIERLAGMGLADVEPGHAYRVLRALERELLLTSRWIPSDAGPARRLYELTPAGSAYLKKRMEELAEFGGVLDAFLSLWTKTSQARGTRESAVAFARP
ncbi:poly-beta-hydroxybutyrate-responsive repressor [Actinomadura pelletieri DSM 43383]|uniref:Poly-beta-hydroxybutyrate-responsive repressor n=1 Tax=Actinomadura pelletieri DSM 43383 TaxID=1120940 RepID=A0A495QX78_9ACTN|nr:helix-turn-helix transcriptional regulator [Actinomadura pelletieri]RKS78799.1 poly-beta-hydroxybutyrate-responsive repressor [Actinomadura pelletieri DSM 43383]